ncbi:MAG: FAD binding domain-containing protein [Thermoplasmata archaeon]|nr:FAD binding domain-containing protein [Thermoplasmata archaeon]MCI4362483.1 FAD binding domain-containing protein [Thermoplasmata archaeon]
MPFTLEQPTTVEEALRRLADPTGGPAVAIAGGTDLLLDLDEGRVSAGRVVSLRRLPWNRLQWQGDSLVVGSTLPFARLGADPAVRARLPGLVDAVDAVGSLALRHRATLGGNLGRAAPASDVVPILLALGATVRLVGIGGHRDVPVGRFVRSSRQTDLAPGELIESISIPSAPVSAYVWQRVRPANDVSQVGVAVARSDSPSGWHVALGGVLPAPTRVVEAEALLARRRPNDAEVELAAQAAAQRATFVTDKRATESYRRRLVSTLVRRAVARALRTEVGG